MSATLEQLGVTLLLGVAVTAITVVLFAVALRLRITHIAHRCEARPRDVIHNPNPHCDPRQRRGNPFLLGWVFWLQSLSYQTLIEGVPGTGTRDGGLTGHLLNVNLDNILLLRFHALGLRVAWIAMIIYCGIALPIYKTSRCYQNPFDEATDLAFNCTESSQYNLTRYDKLTLANIPPVNEAEAFDGSKTGVYIRLYVIVICSYLVCWYTCYELYKEWVDLLAMRRVYYLEYDHWKGRREELKATLNNVDREGCPDSQGRVQTSHDRRLDRREVWIPHPEQRDTPPNIGLYSVLVGSLPKRPQQAVLEEDLEATMSDQAAAIDWQLGVTSAFFDYCVPNQPGFSSSVAAVTVLPSAAELATAWNKWYRATKKLQRLRFIRRLLVDRGYRELKPSHGENGSKPINNNVKDDPHPSGGAANGQQQMVSQLFPDEFNVYLRKESSRDLYTREILGYSTDEDVENMFLNALQMGPEQTAVYSLELAKGSSLCCPHGCCEEQILCASREKLLKMEEDAIRKAHDAFLELEIARKEDAGAVHEPSDEVDSAVKPTTFTFNNVSELGVQSNHSVESKLLSQQKQTDLKPRYSRAKKLKQAQCERQFEVDRANDDENTKDAISIDDKKSDGKQHIADQDHTGDTPNVPRTPPTIDSFLDQRNSRGSKEVVAFRIPGSSDPWDAVTQAANESGILTRIAGQPLGHSVSNGVWNAPSLALLWKDFWKQCSSLLSWTINTSDLAVDLMARDSSFAVVTFTSRQAAIAARKCLADGRGAGLWTTIENIPVPPLADASPFNVCDCRGCCRPVTVSLNDHQKIWRNYFVKTLLVLIYVFYTIPITWAATLGSAAAHSSIPTMSMDATELYGMIRAQLLNLFLGVCPHLFLALANFGSNATSMVQAEFSALQYYWWFFLLFALLGSSVAQMVLNSVTEGSFQFADTLQSVAATIPSQVSSNWANWIILKATVFNPLFYLLQLDSFLFASLGLRCCLRLIRGGGAGNRVPYRIFIEGGGVLLFVLALAPAAPIVAPMAVLYFIICNPILRHALIFTYKPVYDAGAIRFPFLFEMCMSSLLVSQVLLSTMILLKGAIGPAILAGLLSIPTLVYRRTALRRFLDAYQDAALLQTSLLDGWDAPENSYIRSIEGREEFRQFLVDCHKAAYVPACVAGTNTDKVLTAEPAVVVPLPSDNDDEMAFPDLHPIVPIPRPLSKTASEAVSLRLESPGKSPQMGALVRRNMTGSRVPMKTMKRNRPDTPCPSRDDLVMRENVISESVKLSTLGWIQEGPGGEIYVWENNTESQKDL